MIKRNVNETLGFNFYFKEKVTKMVDGENKTIEVDMTKDDMKISEFMEKNIGKRMREMVELETRAKKEIELSKILDELTEKWNINNRFVIDSTSNEIYKPDAIFDDLDDSYAKIADIQSNK
jgi:predicted RND superfamily exporter protein